MLKKYIYTMLLFLTGTNILDGGPKRAIPEGEMRDYFSITYACGWPGCTEKIVGSRNISKHMKQMHPESISLECPWCAQDGTIHTAKHMYGLACHLRTHSKDTPYTCSYCDHAARNSGDLKKHIRIHTGEKPLHCEFCSYACRERSALNKHRSRYHAQIEQHASGSSIQECAQESNPLDDHNNGEEEGADMNVSGEQLSATLNTSLIEFACCWPSCTAKIIGLRNISRHMKQMHPESTSLKCPWCAQDSKIYTAQNMCGMIRHLRKHSGDKPFTCGFCDYASKQLGDLNKHISLHTSSSHEKSFKCMYCNAEFSQNSGLRIHVKKMHPNVDQSIPNSPTRGLLSSALITLPSESLLNGPSNSDDDGASEPVYIDQDEPEPDYFAEDVPPAESGDSIDTDAFFLESD